ncbi:MAG TPA: YciI family protein [Kofleriaceae bacterium]|nr:YciI family protein [Kofleriaceae bacterium]
MVMHKMTDAMEQNVPPDPAIIEGVGKLIEEALQQKIFISGEGLKPSSQRVHIAYKGGKRTITDGPFTEAKELVGGFALMTVRSKEEAISWCDRYAALAGDVELFMGPVVEEWDLGVVPRPENPPLRFLSLPQLDERAGSQAAPDPELAAKMGALIDEMTRAGVLQATGGLTSTQQGARIRFERGKHTVLDGPFAESKELIAGFAILELPSKAAAIEWGVRFGEIVQVNEVEVRQMAE